jgi:DNA processing protein
VNELALAVYASETGTHLVRSPTTRQWGEFLRTFDPAGYLAHLRERGLRFLGRSDRSFPPLLRSIHDPPAGLFVRGGAPLELLAQPSVAIVGARACSGYGASVARMLGRELGRAGLVVVSGLARGVDGEAHRGALEAGAPTVAVLGCGVDRDYPAGNRALAGDIVARGGLVVAEYAPGVEPAPWRFPARNRVVAGLCAATIVVEARERSGALITADLALEEGREVFAVPGEIGSTLSAGTNGLLKLGAAPLTATADVLAAYGIVPVGAAVDSALVDHLPATADELVRRTGMSAAEVARALVELELVGAAVAHEGVYRPC